MGAVVSCTVTVCVTVPRVLPHPSTALQLRAVTKWHEFPEVVSPRFSTVAPLQVSEAVGEVKVGVAGHSRVASLPWPPMVGAVVSLTVTVCVTVPLVLPHPSTARQLRAVTRWHEFPEVVSPRFSTVAPLQVSEAVGEVKVGVAGHSRVASLPCPPIVGAVVSLTVTTCVT